MDLNLIRNKRILFIAPIFHNYHELIIKKLESFGAQVNFFPERKYNFIFKFINNTSQNFLRKYQKNHYKQILNKLNNKKFDYLFVIRGFMIPQEFIERFKEINPDATAIMYQWDSNKTNPFSHVANYFSKIYSFDFADSSDIPFVKYLPLFYTDDLLPFYKNMPEKEYDFFFMGWCFPERYKAVVSFREFSIKNSYKLKAFLYMPFSSYVKELLRGNILDKSIVSFTPMSRAEYLNTLAKSKVMVDVSNPNQTGLAMRVIEALALDIKVLTNNFNLKMDANIGNSSNVAFFNDNNIIVENNFVTSLDSSKSSDKVGSIENWLSQIFKTDEY